jgi:hypothetical protein
MPTTSPSSTWTVPQVSVLGIGLVIRSAGDGLVVALDAVNW